VEPVVGIASTETETVRSLNIYPNPTNGKFSLSFELQEKSDVDISVYNTRGQLAWNKTRFDASGKVEEKVNLSDFPAGLYYVNVKVGDELIKQQLLVK